MKAKKLFFRPPTVPNVESTDVICRMHIMSPAGPTSSKAIYLLSLTGLVAGCLFNNGTELFYINNTKEDE